jgi:hypothetical protein
MSESMGRRQDLKRKRDQEHDIPSETTGDDTTSDAAMDIDHQGLNGKPEPNTTMPLPQPQPDIDGFLRPAKGPAQVSPEARMLNYFTDLARSLGVPVDEAKKDPSAAGIVREYYASPLEDESESDAEADPRRLKGLEPIELRPRAASTGDVPMMPSDEERRLALDELRKHNALLRQQYYWERQSKGLHARKPTIYQYVKGGNEGSALYTETLQTDKVMQRAEAGDSDVDDTAFSIEKFPIPEFAPEDQTNRTRISGKQGPHRVAHVFLQHGIDQSVPGSKVDPNMTMRERWDRLEQAFCTMVYRPEQYYEIAMKEFEAGTASKAVNAEESRKKIALAAQRHQELFNQIESLLDEASFRRNLLNQQLYGPKESNDFKDEIERDLEIFYHARNLFAEIMELAPFGTYAWNRETGATNEELKGKKERSKGFLSARKQLVGAGQNPKARLQALTQMAKELAVLIDDGTGEFSDADAYKCFMLTTLELAGAPEDTDLLFDLIMKAKGKS